LKNGFGGGLKDFFWGGEKSREGVDGLIVFYGI
jgi:hypothetical protein